MQGMKQCPRCAEEIQDEAVTCRFCGHDQSGSRRFALSINQMGCGGCLIWGLLFLLVAAIIGAVIEPQHWNWRN